MKQPETQKGSVPIIGQTEGGNVSTTNPGPIRSCVYQKGHVYGVKSGEKSGEKSKY